MKEQSPFVFSVCLNCMHVLLGFCASSVLCGVRTQLSVLKARIPTPSLPLPKLATFLNTVNSPQVTMLKQLGCIGGSFGFLQLIPLLVSLYDWLYETQSYAITIAEAQTERSMLSVFEDAPYVCTVSYLLLMVVCC